MRPLLGLFPHPDDETFTSAGVMAAAAERGVPISVVSATRGEAGESGVSGLDDPEQLGKVREDELREAMRQVGVSDVRFLGYRDSGMEGSPEAEHERAFVRAPVAAVAAQLRPLIRAIRPQIVITFGPEGIYGHPDHLHMHHVAIRAIRDAADPAYSAGADGEPWRTPSVYFATFPREEMLALAGRPGGPLESLSPEARARLGRPMAEITHVVDIEPWAQPKRAAIFAHRTQTGDKGPLSGIPPEVLEWQLAREFFVRASLPWTIDNAENDIIETLAMARAGG